MRVHHKERAKGCDKRLLAFLDWWEASGPFELTICPDGGLRTDDTTQREFFLKGLSKARTIAETPHGRAGALDIAPVIDGRVPWEREGLFAVIGSMAKARGLEWGGDWPHPDRDHIQVPNWRQLPYPPVSPAVS